MNAILAALPASWRKRTKAIVAALGALFSALAVAVPDIPDWVLVVVGILTALGVYATPAPGYTYPKDNEQP